MALACAKRCYVIAHAPCVLHGDGGISPALCLTSVLRPYCCIVGVLLAHCRADADILAKNGPMYPPVTFVPLIHLDGQ